MQASISSQVTGAETNGAALARSVYGVAVVLRAAFWLWSMNTRPGRSRRAMVAMASPGSAAAASAARLLA